MKGLLGKKVGMTQVFKEDGTLVPVTVIESKGMQVVQIKTEGKEGYNSVQVGFGDIKEKNVNKPKKGHFSKSKVENKRMLKEFKIDNPDDFEIGQEIKVDIFEEGEIVDVEGTSKGKGFQGNIKRHNQSRGPETHGSKYHRAVGSMGASAHPARVFKTKKLPGHMGHEKVTVKNLEIVRVDLDKNLLLVKGAVPGPKKGTVIIKKK
jgi:large subunit ribosomal protein L3